MISLKSYETLSNDINGLAEKASTYEYAVSKLIKAVNETLKESWEGVDTDAYVTKIVGSEADLKEPTKVIQSFSKYLSDVHASLTEAQEKIRSAAAGAEK